MRPYAGRSADDRSAERRERLLEAGLELFATVGAAGATMTAICAHAKLTERYFYQSFSSKEDLLKQVIAAVSSEVRVAALDALASPASTVEKQVENAISAFVGVMTADRRKGRVAMIESSAVESLRAYRQELLRDFASLVAEQAHALYGDRAWSTPRSEINAILFVGGLAELVVTWLNGEIDVTPTQIVAAATDNFVSTARRP
ncbi:TetR family transcriptional regulator [Rhodococcoides trifolii]|uniref:TetR family transcriptional regulator n=1 Tax=Rhodococcoides trifolii TaxID=908250 RepID=A0A917LHK2_9NOCA|nr:TetR family transcriptional regulator [Rhodococcus trifolii]